MHSVRVLLVCTLIGLAFCRLALNELHHDWAEAVNKAHQSHAKRAINTLPNTLVDNLETYFTTMNGCEAMQVPGSAVTVIQGGAVILEKAFGKSNVAQNVDATVDTVFGIGSTTKAITGFIVGSLVDDGLLSFETKVSDVIPEWHIPANDVTVEDALLHRLDYTKNNFLWFYNISNYDARDLAQNWQTNFPPIFPLRYQWDYFNFGFSLATAVASTVTNKAYADLVKERFFAPLGLTSGAYAKHGDALREVPDLYAYPYTITPDFEVVPIRPDANTVLDGAVAGAGSLVMSIKSVTKYLTALETGLSDVVTSDTFGRCTLPRTDTWPTAVLAIDPFQTWWHSYGYGWITGTYRGQRFLWHNGDTIGHTAMFLVFPDQNIEVGVLTNMGGITGITHFLFGIYAFDQIMGYDDTFITPDLICFVASAVPVNTDYLGLSSTVNHPQKFAGTYCNCLWKQVVVSRVGANKLSLKIGAASGLLYNQNGNQFEWYGEEFPEPEKRIVTFGTNQLNIDLHAEDGSSSTGPVVFPKGNCNSCKRNYI